MDVTGLVQAAGVAAAVLLGVWRMFVHYEQRHDAAHADLGRRIDGVNARIDNLYLRVDNLYQRIDNLYQWLVDRERK